MKSIYIAGPDIFYPNALDIADRQRRLCVRYGLVPLHPLDGGGEPGHTAEAAVAIFQANRSKMLAADAIIADLTPFRGPSADPGTVFELGFMLALERPVFAYSRTARPYLERMVAIDPRAVRDPETGRWTDENGIEIEDFGLADNLMIDCALRSIGSVLVTPEGVVSEPPGGLGCFERCLDQARTRLG